MPSSSWYWRERAADRHVERGLVVRQVVPVRVAVARGEAELGSLLADGERHLVEHDEGRDDLRDARDRHAGRRRMRRPARCLPPRPTALPAAGPGERGGRVRRSARTCTRLDGRRRPRAAATAGSWPEYAADQQRDDRDRNEDAGAQAATGAAGRSADPVRPARRAMPRRSRLRERARSATIALRRPRRARRGAVARGAVEGTAGRVVVDRRTRPVRRRSTAAVEAPTTAPESTTSDGLAAAACACAPRRRTWPSARMQPAVPRPDAAPPAVRHASHPRAPSGRGCGGVVQSHPLKSTSSDAAL